MDGSSNATNNLVVSFFTPFNDKGISRYSEQLMAKITKVSKGGISLKVVGIDQPYLIKYNPVLYIQSILLYRSLGQKMNDADIAHIQHEYSLFCLWTNPIENMYRFFRRQIKIPVIITVHELEHRKKSKKIILNAIKFFYYFLLTRYLDYVNRGMFEECDGIIVHTKKAASELRERGITTAKIHIIPHGIPLPDLSLHSKSEDRKKFHFSDSRSIPDTAYVLMTYGYISFRKGQDIVIDAMSELPEDIVYVIAGSVGEGQEAYLAHLKKKVQEKKLERRVIFTGHIPDTDVAMLMNAADLCLYPAREITASGVISEYIGYEKQILASDLPFVQEINTVLACIHTFTPENIDDLVEKVLLIKDAKASIPLENVQTYKLEFSYTGAAKKTVALYHEIAGK